MQNNEIRDFVINHMSKPENNTLGAMPLPAFGTPVVGFANGADTLFQFYKKHIGENFYRLPTEWLNAAYPDAGFTPENVTVISWILPQTEDTKTKCREHDDCPSLEWLYARVNGEDCNRKLAAALRDFLRGMGIRAVAPMLEESFHWEKSEKFTIASNWSERHTAHICGLGTFGLCDGLITPVGKAVRIGSVIADIKLEPTKRPYTEYNEYCLHRFGCNACIDRCPAKAISDAGHNKIKCTEYHSEFIKKIAKERYGYEGYAVCGLCQTGVPCESGIPKMPRK